MDAAVSRARIARFVALLLTCGFAATAASLFIQFAANNGVQLLDVVRLVLITLSTLWLAWGASQSVVGLFHRPTPPVVDIVRPTKRTAILVPVYNEDPAETFSRVLAMDRALVREGVSGLFDFVVLSDTRNAEIVELEQEWFARLVSEARAKGRMFYRHRADNAGKKAGNIEDFITKHGGAYEFALILDADSLMSGQTIVEMARRMEAEPQLGLLQTLPHIINARSGFGRGMQFAASFFSPVFARGIALLAGREGPFWGHNAMVRTRAFAASCGLPALKGQPPFGGPVLSHDYVEAALLARAGWLVRLDTDLGGSFEEGPDNLIEFAKRDRRWCQGNLQHTRLLAAPGLSTWSRFVFVQGILAYLSSPIWAAFLILGLVAPYFAPPTDYFPQPYQLFPVFPDDQTSKAITLLVGIFGLLILPKLLILGEAIVTGRVKAFGGALRAGASVISEIATSSVLAPVMLLFQTRSVMQVLTGTDGGWPATSRGTSELRFSEAWAATRWMVAIGAATLLAAAYWAPGMLLWLVPVAVPMLAAPVIIWATARPMGGPIYITGQELAPDPIVAERERILMLWRGETQSAIDEVPSVGEGAATHA